MRAAIVAAVLAACDAPPPPTAPTTPPARDPWVAPVDDLMATLQRTGCLGWCPIYKLVIHRDGRIEYIGDHFVKLRGSADGRLTQAQLDELDRAFARAHYFDLEASYEHYDVTDNPSQITSYHLNGRTKTIVHYNGDSQAPDELWKLEDSIDSIVGTERWIGTEAERSKHMNDWY